MVTAKPLKQDQQKIPCYRSRRDERHLCPPCGDWQALPETGVAEPTDGSKECRQRAPRGPLAIRIIQPLSRGTESSNPPSSSSESATNRALEWGRRSRPAPHADLARDPREPDPHHIEGDARIADVVEALSTPLFGRKAPDGIVEVAENLQRVVATGSRKPLVRLSISPGPRSPSNLLI
jgi:hypothetical protein